MKGLLGGLLTVLALASAGCDFPGRPRPSDRPLPADQVVDFDTLYRRNCAGCHGSRGKLGPAPPLNDPLFLAIVPDAELYRVIAEGRAGTPMPAFARSRGGPLTIEQIRALARGIKPRWKSGDEMAAANEVPPYLAAGAMSDRGDAGAAVFDRACAVCHGEDGKGGDDAGAINDPAFLSLISDQALRRYVITGRPDLGMPGYAGSDGRGDDFRPLTPGEIDDLVALLARWRRGATGDGS